MLRHRRPPALCRTVEAPMTATLAGFANESGGCRGTLIARPATVMRPPRRRSFLFALEAGRALLRERARPLLGVFRLVDQGGDRAVEAQRVVRVLVQGAPRQLLGDLDRDGPV